MELAYIGLGSNLGDRIKNLEGAIERLQQLGPIEKISRVYETKPWGVEGYQPRYLNQVVSVGTTLDPLELLSELLGIEHSMGRVRSDKNESRTLDLDLLIHGESVVEASGVTVPHPRLHERAFVLVPLADIAPDLIHPVFNRKISELLLECDQSGVKAMS